MGEARWVGRMVKRNGLSRTVKHKRERATYLPRQDTFHSDLTSKKCSREGEANALNIFHCDFTN